MAVGVDQRGIARPQGAKCDIGSVEVVQVAPTVDGPATADFTVGSAAAPVGFTTTGTPQATLSASALPSGVTFTDNGDGTGTLAGTPAVGTGGDYTITITGTNEAGSGTKDIVLTIHEAPILSGPSAATYQVGQAGGPDEFTQTAGHPTATLSTDSTLPGGVNFTPQPGGKGTIGGTPTAGSGGVYPITIKGSNGTPPDATWPFVLTVEESTGITGPGNATFTVGTAGHLRRVHRHAATRPDLQRRRPARRAEHRQHRFRQGARSPARRPTAPEACTTSRSPRPTASAPTPPSRSR